MSNELISQDGSNGFQEYHGVPNEPYRQKEKSRWQQFWEWLLPGLKTKWEQAEKVLEARVRQEQGKALQEEGKGRQEIAKSRILEERAREISELATKREAEATLDADFSVVDDEDCLREEIKSLKEEIELLRLTRAAEFEFSVRANKPEAEIERTRRLLTKNLSELDFSVRLHDVFSSNGISTIRELVQYTQAEALNLEGMTFKLLLELSQVLEEQGLEFDMVVEAYE